MPQTFQPSRKPVYSPGKRIAATTPVRRATYTAPSAPPVRVTTAAPALDPSLPADTLTATPETATRARRATYTPPADAAPTSRPRRATYTPPAQNPPPGFAQTATAQDAYQEALTQPVEDGNGRARSGAFMSLAGINAGGQPPDNLGSALGRLAGGFLGGVLFPSSDEKLARAHNLPLLKAAADQEREAEQQRQKNLDAESERGLRKAQENYWNARPGIEQSKSDARARKDAQAGVRADLKLHPHPFDPNSAADAELLHRAADAQIFLDVDNWGRGGKNDRAVTFVDPDNPTRVLNGTYNTFTGEVAPLTLNGQPVQKGYVAPIHTDTEMTATQEHTDADRDASRAETGRHNRVTESQGTERIGQGKEHLEIARENQAHRGEPTATSTNSRLARAAELARRLEDEKNRAAHPPSFNPATGQPSTPEYQRAYAERHLQAARGYAQSITDAYGDLYEAGPGDGGVPYAKAKTQPLTRGAGASAGGQTRPRIRQVNIGAAVDDLIKAGRFKDKQSAEAYVREHMDVIP